MMQEDDDLHDIVEQAELHDIENLFTQTEESLNMPQLHNTELRTRLRQILHVLKQKTHHAVEDLIGTPEDRKEYYRENLHPLPSLTDDESIPGKESEA